MTVNIACTLAKELKELPAAELLRFGSHTTDHLFMVNYRCGQGWHNPRIVPYGAISLDPSALVLHYAQAIFEGLKIFRRDDGNINIFRPDRNAARLNQSAEKMAMPPVPEEVFVQGLKKLAQVDERWIPDKPGYSLYARPVMIATEPALGVKASDEYLFYMLLTPVPSYYVPGGQGFRLSASQRRSRSAIADVSDAKTAGNYGKTIKSLSEMQKDGFDNILWLGGRDCRFIEEAGITNVFIRTQTGYITPPLNGRILPGITRDSVITILRTEGHNVIEREIGIDELIHGIDKHEVLEMFVTGTATVVAPVASVEFGGKEHALPECEDSTAAFLYEHITSIQTGRKVDPYGWSLQIKSST